MSTRKETIDYILEQLDDPNVFSARAMFGEYALYVDGRVVALICDDTLYVKILLASAELEPLCEKGSPYPGAKEHYVIAEEQLNTVKNLPTILVAIATALPAKKPKKSVK